LNREEMLKQLTELSHPITEGLVISGGICEFSILTNQKGYSCLVGGAFPIIGPKKITHAQHRDITKLLALRKNESLEETIDENIHGEARKGFLLNLCDTLGTDAIEEIIRIDWPPNKSFYIFHDMGRGESAMFASLKSAYEYFLSYFMEIEEGINWETMTDEILIEWYEMLENWRASGSKKLPPKEWLGVYYSGFSGMGIL